MGWAAMAADFFSGDRAQISEHLFDLSRRKALRPARVLALLPSPVHPRLGRQEKHLSLVQDFSQCSECHKNMREVPFEEKSHKLLARIGST